MRELIADPHVRERGVFVNVDGILMQAPAARLSRTPGEVRHAGRELGADTDEVLGGVATPDAAKPPLRGESDHGD